MRRLVSSVLTLVLLLQAPAAAGATTLGAAGSGPSLLEQFGAAFHPVIAAAQQSFIVAVLTGQGDRYSLMHAAKPQLDRNAVEDVIEREPPGLPRPVAARARYGTVVPLHMVAPGAGPPGSAVPTPAPRNAPLLGAMSREASQVSGRGSARAITASPIPVRTAPVAPTPVAPSTPSATPVPATTGIIPWWTYQGGRIPGAGIWANNVANGNFIVAAQDMAVPERGVGFVFARAYNSQSTHDQLNTDASVQGIYGRGWTNTFDAHMAYNDADGFMSVYDANGTRWDYAPVTGGTMAPASARRMEVTPNGTVEAWAPLAGNAAQLSYDGSCGYYWTQKDGSELHFVSPLPECSNPAATLGRLYQIVGRNHNNIITLSYAFTGSNGSTIQNLSTITATHSDGQYITLSFSDVNGYTELTSLTRTDGTAIDYYYDAYDDLIKVCLPANSGTSPPASRCDSYAYSSGTSPVMTAALSPRAYLSATETDAAFTDGDEVEFGVNSSRQLTSADDYGVVNFTPADNTGIVLQSGVETGPQFWH
ncbi:MAG TPA: DUF6531 domain-containing protein, partial [Candidatus Acidoferrales bacterium]|nr:DUF6531 domain-containing protein [Candidatus Acidoferrales bacterium]